AAADRCRPQAFGDRVADGDFGEDGERLPRAAAREDAHEEHRRAHPLRGRAQAARLANAGQPEAKRRAATGLARRADHASVALHDALRGREADPGPLELGWAVEPLEYAEEFRGEFHVEPDAVVPYEIVFRIKADLDDRPVVLARVLERVSYE